MSTAKVTLYRAAVKMRPTPAHPQYFQIEQGFVVLWLYAESTYDAAERASAIVAQLPYEVNEEEPITVTPDVLGENKKWAFQVEQAEQCGLSIQLVCLPTGTSFKIDV